MSALRTPFKRPTCPLRCWASCATWPSRWTTPLAVRSSGWLEDTTDMPFAGIYQTKMIPNNGFDPDVRFQKLVEAIKLVWASTFFKVAKDYCQATCLCTGDEKMAVIIQEVVGKTHADRFYPELSGVARSFNYYPLKPARPEDGVISLALGLGKTIVDGDKTWIYSPAYPGKPAPYKSLEELIEQTQNEFWVVGLSKPLEYNPIKETEFLQRLNLTTAEKDGTLARLVSTYDPESDRLSMGTGSRGPRVLNFAPLLTMNDTGFNDLITELLIRCEQKLGCPVEIEFAITFDPHHFGFLQVRPMVVPSSIVELSSSDLAQDNVLLASEAALGNGSAQDITDIVYVIPERFDLKDTRQIAKELEQYNQRLMAEKRPYVLMVFGRLGTLDPWLGIPVTWGQICGAKVIVEATQYNVRVELSQGSHYFHNIINLGVMYFSMPTYSPYYIDWGWIEKQPAVHESEFVRHVRLPAPLSIKVDGRSSRGVITTPFL